MDFKKLQNYAGYIFKDSQGRAIHDGVNVVTLQYLLENYPIRIENITLAAKLIHKPDMFVRIGLRKRPGDPGRLPYGDAVQTKLGSWSYYVSTLKFLEHTGLLDSIAALTELGLSETVKAG